MSFHWPSHHHDQVWGYQPTGGHGSTTAVPHNDHASFSRADAKSALDFLAENNLSHPRKADQIQPGLYLGDLPSAKDFSALSEKHVTHVLSVCPCPGLEYPSFMNITHKVLPVTDDSEEDLLDYFLECWRFITYALDEGGRVHVHCEQGISRSVTILAAFLMKTERLHSLEAIRYIQKFRPIADPNAGFREQLHIWGQCKGDLKNSHDYTIWKQKREARRIVHHQHA